VQSVDLRSSGQDSVCLSGSQRKEAVSDHMGTSSADTGKVHSGVETSVGRFTLTSFEGGLSCLGN